ncbi:MAG: Brp/Blh family beta-carotene 15,15'-monooxygenase [Dokdonia donghaensis]|uniref:Brp/Blh family beta-carotene 15,15'-dioxygenase n=1 Tax=Dokdonia donghaensis TaxID=326320 RepID=UPI0035C7C25A
MKNIRIVITFFLLWLSIQFNSTIEDIIAYVAIFTLGLVHGANDIKLLEKNVSSSPNHKYVILGRYVLIVLAIAILFYVIPSLALILFILVSGFHFGEEHWDKLIVTKDKGHYLFYTAYGLLILFLIFYLNSDETTEIIAIITGFTLDSYYYLVGLIFFAIITIASFMIGRVQMNAVSSILEEFVHLIILAIVFKMATLLLSFALYFVVWHAIPSMKSQIIYLYGNTSQKSIVGYLRSSLAYWLLAITSISIFYYYVGDKTYLFNAIFFAFLAAITFPHVWIINSLRK